MSNSTRPPQDCRVKLNPENTAFNISYTCPKCGAAIEREFRPGVLLGSGFYIECAQCHPSDQDKRFTILFTPGWDCWFPGGTA